MIINCVSVRYAEELNSGKSSVLLQRADRHGILGEKRPGFGNVLKVEMAVKTRGFTALKTEICGLDRWH